MCTEKVESVHFVVDYESVSEVINSKRAALGEVGRSLTLPRCNPFKMPEAPVRNMSIDGRSGVCLIEVCNYCQYLSVAVHVIVV